MAELHATRQTVRAIQTDSVRCDSGGAKWIERWIVESSEIKSSRIIRCSIKVMGIPANLTEAEQLSDAMAHPDANSIWVRALDTFGDESKARHWMNSPRDIFDGRSPKQLVETNDPDEQRRVLTVLIRIDYGVFS